MKFSNSRFAIFALVASSMLNHAYADRVTSVYGQTAHGINVYNGEPLADYSSVSPTIPWLNPVVPVTEIGVFDSTPGATDAEVITDITDSARPLATIGTFTTFFGLQGSVDPMLFNMTLDQVESNFFGSTAPVDRAPVGKFEGASVNVYAAKGVNSKPTVGDWAAIKGRLDYQCSDNGTSTVEIGIKNGLPKSIYTMWDVGAVNPLTIDEAGYAVPLGGLPNVFVTDANGCGHAKVELPYCLARPCEAGASSCTNYVSIFYHFDDQVYGGAPAESFMGVPVGSIGANHMVWNITGTPLSQSNKRLKGPLKCNRKKTNKH